MRNPDNELRMQRKEGESILEYGPFPLENPQDEKPETIAEPGST